MCDQYAVYDGETILYQTEGFSRDAVTDTVALSDGKTLLVCAQDRETLRRRLRDAEEAIAAKDNFLSNMSHDIRTPMNAIVGLTLLAKMHLDETARVADALSKIETASGHLLNLINDVLDMSRINSGRMQITPEDFSLNDLIHETYVIVRPQAEKKGHTLRFVTGDIDAETLRGDSLRLRQIFVNIIGNAVKYTPDGGVVTVRFAEETKGASCLLLFTCEDNGIGMSEEFLQRIFTPFERVQNSTVSRIEGTGLGMSIVAKLTEAMGGTVDVKSKPNEGTTVTVRVPLECREESLPAETLRGKRVLVLEADVPLRERYERFLSSFGVTTAITASVQEALDALAGADISGEGFDAAILGNECGASDKLDIAAYLHRLAPQLPLLLISDDNWEIIGYQAEQSGIITFIPLPLMRKRLAAGLETALNLTADSTAASATPDLQGLRLLLVDDNFINREIAIEILRSTGADIDTAENGQEALDRFLASEEGSYACVLMDVQMPVMDGYEATRRIRESGRGDATLPVFAMTANTFAEDIARAREAGMDTHIPKPIDVDSLMQALKRALGR